jgi:allantoinase
MSITAFHSYRTITANTVKEATVLVENGKIINVSDGKVIPAGIAVFEAGNHVLMPGVVDPHVHINEPGREDWEGFDTATKAAIAGGVTTLVEMPLNASPVTTTIAAFEKKLAAAKGKLHTNSGFWGGIVPGNAGQIKPLAEKGILGFKAFLTHSGIDEFPNVTEADLDIAMPFIAQTGLPLLVHCELSDHLAGGSNPQSYQQYLASRPKEWEDRAIALMIGLCEKYRCGVHIVHLSSAGSIEQIASAKKKGLPLTVETAQHYLFFNAEEIKDGRTEFKCAPPIRERSNNELLWEALKDGTIDFVATDHSPAPPYMKEMESGNLIKAWGGIASIQFALPALWTAAYEHHAGIIDIANWLCKKPAILPGLNDRKGSIETGYDADFVIWDPEESFIIDEPMIHHRHKATPYLGQTLKGVVHQTFINGEKVFDKGSFTALNRGSILANGTGK